MTGAPRRRWHVVPWPRFPASPGSLSSATPWTSQGDLRAFLTEQYLQLGPVFRVTAFHRSYVVLAGVEANRFFAALGKATSGTARRGRTSSRRWGRSGPCSPSMVPITSGNRREQKRAYSRRYAEGHLEEAANIARREIETWPIAKPIRGHYALQRIITEQLGVLAAATSPREYLDDLIVFCRSDAAHPRPSSASEALSATAAHSTRQQTRRPPVRKSTGGDTRRRNARARTPT